MKEHEISGTKKNGRQGAKKIEWSEDMKSKTEDERWEILWASIRKNE